jgi:hypothetical protein
MVPEAAEGSMACERARNARCLHSLMAALLLGSIAGFTPTVLAHDVTMTETAVSFRTDGTFSIDFFYDVYADLAQARPGHLGPADMVAIESMPKEQRETKLNEVRQMLWRRVKPRFDGQPTKYMIDFISAPRRQVLTGSLAPPMPVIAHLTGTIPAGARVFTFWASKSFGEIAMRIGREGGPEGSELVERGNQSKPFVLSTASTQASEATSSGRMETALAYLKLGYEHILPEGLDHILFVLGLFLLGNKLGPLLWQISAFTVAHTITLALSTYGIASLPSRVVEPLIALSIAYVAVENIWLSRRHETNAPGRDMPWRRPVIVFCFGLLHGMGFAGVLSELGLPGDQFLTALLSFNVGVELGQLSVIALAFLAVGWFRDRPWYRNRITTPASALIAIIGAFWFVQRLFIA